MRKLRRKLTRKETLKASSCASYQRSYNAHIVFATLHLEVCIVDAERLLQRSTTEGSTSVAVSARGTVRSEAPGGNLAVQLPSGLRNAVCLHGHGLGGG